MTASEKILKRLEEAQRALACHELDVIGVTENAAATRLSELQALGKVVGIYRKGKRFKEWSLAPCVRDEIMEIKFDQSGQGMFV